MRSITDCESCSVSLTSPMLAQRVCPRTARHMVGVSQPFSYYWVGSRRVIYFSVACRTLITELAGCRAEWLWGARHAAGGSRDTLPLEPGSKLPAGRRSNLLRCMDDA